MKIRQGFVSNSSSTSFCIYGVSSDLSEEIINNILEIINDYRPINAKIENEDYNIEESDEDESYEEEEEEDEEEFDYDEWDAKISDIEQKLGVSIYHSWECERMYIGLDIGDMNLDETMRQFQERAKSKLKQLENVLDLDDLGLIVEEIDS